MRVEHPVHLLALVEAPGQPPLRFLAKPITRLTLRFCGPPRASKTKAAQAWLMILFLTFLLGGVFTMLPALLADVIWANGPGRPSDTPAWVGVPIVLWMLLGVPATLITAWRGARLAAFLYSAHFNRLPDEKQAKQDRANLPQDLAAISVEGPNGTPCFELDRVGRAIDGLVQARRFPIGLFLFRKSTGGWSTYFNRKDGSWISMLYVAADQDDRVLPDDEALAAAAHILKNDLEQLIIELQTGFTHDPNNVLVKIGHDTLTPTKWT